MGHDLARTAYETREQLERLLAYEKATPDKVLVDDLKAVLSMPLTKPEESENEKL